MIWMKVVLYYKNAKLKHISVGFGPCEKLIHSCLGNTLNLLTSPNIVMYVSYVGDTEFAVIPYQPAGGIFKHKLIYEVDER